MYSISTTSLQSLYVPPAKAKTAAVKDGSKMSFSQYLDSAKEETEEITIPDKWRTDQPKNAIDIAVAYMRDELGIDVDSRVPTYEITEEQKEWLSSRHDLSKLHEYSFASAERQNFLADLVYLNVISADEAKMVGLTQVPMGRIGVLERVEGTRFTVDAPQNKYRNFAELLAGVLESQSKFISYMQDKADDPQRSEPEDFDYLESALKYAELHRKLYEALLGLYE